MKANIKIVHQAMNTDRAYACGLIVKLTYVIYDHKQPRLEVFLDNELTRSEDWDIYGANHNRADCYRGVSFYGFNDKQQFELDDRRFEIEYTDTSEQEVNYASGSKVRELAYHFEIKALNLQ